MLYYKVNQNYNNFTVVINKKPITLIADELFTVTELNNKGLTKITAPNVFTTLEISRKNTHIINGHRFMKTVGTTNLTEAQLIKVKRLLGLFRQKYKFLYDNYIDTSKYTKLLDEFDEFIKIHPDVVAEFNKLREDILTSDREVIAFMMAVKEIDNN